MHSNGYCLKKPSKLLLIICRKFTEGDFEVSRYTFNVKARMNGATSIEGGLTILTAPEAILESCLISPINTKMHYIYIK